MSNSAEPVTMDEEKVEILNNYFASVSSNSLSPYGSHIDGSHDGDQGDKVPPISTVSKDKVYDHLRNWNICKSMGPDEIHPRILSELTDIVAKLLSMIFEKSWQSGEVTGDWKK